MPANLGGGSYGGAPPPGRVSGFTYLPTNYHLIGSVASAAALNDMYYYPMWIQKTQTFSGAKLWNGGAGDNTKLIRIGVYTDNNGPASLVHDFGAITLTGASALRTLASSVTLAGPAWYWICHASQAFTYTSMGFQTGLSGVGVEVPSPFITQAFGYSLSTQPSGTALTNIPCGFYVSTAYGAMASTAVAPTSEISANYAGGVINCPMVGLYV